MKRTLLLLATAFSLTCPALVQADTPSTDAPPGGHHGGGGMGLTSDERTELKTAHDAAIKANPDLETEGKQLKEQFRAYEKKMHDAMVAADPNVEPILTKMDAGHHHHGPPMGGGGGDDSNN